MIEQGHDLLRPYLEFRNWLSEIRNYPKYRCRRRRNGVDAPGPINLTGRKEILTRIDRLEVLTGQQILSAAQRQRITELWLRDLESTHYLSIE